MYEELERDEDGKLTPEQIVKLTPEDAEKHFLDLYNLSPLYEGHELAFMKILQEAGYDDENILKMKRKAAVKSDWRKNNIVNNRMDRQRLTPLPTAHIR